VTTPAERFLTRVRRRLAALQPQAVAAYLRGLRTLAADLDGTREVERAASVAYSAARTGGPHLLDAELSDAFRPLLSDERVDRAFSRFRSVTQGAAQDGVLHFARDIPGAARFDVDTSFGVLQPRVVEALRTVDDRAMGRIRSDMRESVRAIYVQAYEAGEGPRKAAARLRGLLGLSPSELAQVENFKAALSGAAGRDWRGYTARDWRYDRAIERALSTGEGLTPARVQQMTDAYAKKRLAISAENHARTTMLNANKLAQQAAWQTAVEQGIIDGRLLEKEWMTVGDSRVRDEHNAVRGETAPFSEPYSNGQVIPGESDWNCRCWSRIYARRG
jgi:hypothetical protein